MGNTCSGNAEETGEVNVKSLKGKGQQTHKTEFKPETVTYNDDDKEKIVKIQAAAKGRKAR
jgi:hypothetical protein